MLRLFRKIAFPFSLLYALVVHFRNWLFDVGVFSSKSYKTPTICVGNLSVGGTGKTPMTELLIRMLEGKRLATLSRGYKRKTEGFVLAMPHSTVLDLGDEPFQLYRKFPDIAVSVDSDRRNGIEQLETLIKPEVIILDDAFQHRKVRPAFSILLTAYQKLYVDDWYLPTGDLRDSKGQAKRANLIIVTKCPELPDEKERVRIGKRLRPLPHQKVLFATLHYAEMVSNGSGKNLSFDDLKSTKVALVTGIASPEPLVEHLSAQKIQFDHFRFGDHHNFTVSDIDKFRDYQIILTTEKDFVRLDGKVKNLFYLEISHHLNQDDGAVLAESLAELV